MMENIITVTEHRNLRVKLTVLIQLWYPVQYNS